MQSILVMGDGALANGVGDALVAAGREVRRLRRWNDRELRRELEGDVSAVVVVSRDDIAVLRSALLVEYLKPGVRLIATIFDRTVADQVIAAIPNCEVISMADAAVGAVLGPCVDARLAMLQREPGGTSWRSRPTRSRAWSTSTTTRRRATTGSCAGCPSSCARTTRCLG